MSRVRIAINTTPAVEGGGVTHLRHLLPALAECITNEEVFVIGDAAMRESLQSDGELPWIETPLLGKGLARRLQHENIRLPKIIDELRCDVLLHPGNFGLFRCPIPQVTLVHNVAPFLPEVIRLESLGQRIRLRLLGILTRYTQRRVEGVIFISKYGRALSLGDDPVDDARMPIIPFGAEHGLVEGSQELLDRWDLAPDQYVLTVSHLYRYKNVEKLLDAYAELGERVEDWPLLVVGNPFDQEYERELIARARGSRAPVIFTGPLDATTLASLMADCRAFVFTSEAENLPITLLEAMAASCPIITNRHCSMPEVCEDAALYAEPASASEYRARLEELLWDDEARAALRRRSGERGAEFSWRRTAEMTLSFLREIAAQGKKRR